VYILYHRDYNSAGVI